MPDIVVKTPQGETFRFPEGMSRQEITSAIGSFYDKQQDAPEQKSPFWGVDPSLAEKEALKQPWLDPTTVVPSAAGTTFALAKGVPLASRALYSLLSGGAAGIAEYPIGMATEQLPDKWQLPANLAMGVASGVAEDNLARMAARKLPQVAGRFGKALLGGKKAAEGVIEEVPKAVAKDIPVAQKIANYKAEFGKHPTSDLIAEWWGVAKKYKPDEVKIPVSAPETIGDVAEEGAEQLPKYAGSINLHRQNIPVKAKLNEFVNAQAAGGKITKPHEQTIKEAQELLTEWSTNPAKRVDRVKELLNGNATPNEAEILAHRFINADKQTEFIEIAKKLDKGEIAPDAFLEYEKALIRDQSVVNKLASQAGRNLNIHNIAVGRDRAFKAISKLKNGLNERQRKALAHVDWDDPASVQDFISRHVESPKLKDYLYEFWYNSILSGPPTHVVNFLSNSIWGAFQVPHRMLVGGVDKVWSMLPNKTRNVYINEAIPMLAGYKPGLKKAIPEAWKAFKGESMADIVDSKWVKDMGQAAGAFNRSPHKSLRTIGKFITLPTKALRAMDVWGGAIAEGQQAAALARRASNKMGIKGLERKAFEREWIRNLPKNREALDELAKYRQYATFMDDPGKIGNAFMYARDNIPGGRLIIPFVRTIGNLMKRGLEMTPGVGIALSRGQSAPEVIAKQIEGAIGTAIIFDKMLKGEITGGMPESEAERASWYRQEKKPWAVKIGDSWYSYRRVEPFGTPIAVMSQLYNSIMESIEGVEKDEAALDIATDVFMDAADQFKNYIIDSSYTQGVAQIINRHGKLKGTVQRTVTSWVPYSSFWRSINRAYEAAVEGQAYVRENDTWLGALSQTVPGLYKGQPVELNVWGEPEAFEGGPSRHLVPYKWSEEKGGVLEKSLEKLDMYPALPSREFTNPRTLKKEQFDEDIYREFVIDRGKKLKPLLERYFSRPHIQLLIDDEIKQEIVRRGANSILNSVTKPYRALAIRKQLSK